MSNRIDTLNIPLILAARETTNVFISELWEIILSGLRVLRILRILIIGMLMFVDAASISDVTTIKKSS